MKIRKILCALLVAVMIGTAVLMAGCGSKVESNVHIKFIATVDPDGNALEDELIIGETDVTVEGTKENPPTVLKAAQIALGELSYEEGYEVTSDGYSIARIKNYKEHQEADEVTGYYTYWDAYVDGERSTDGRQSETPVYDGSEIVFKFISDSKPREDKTGYVDETEAE